MSQYTLNPASPVSSLLLGHIRYTPDEVKPHSKYSSSQSIGLSGQSFFFSAFESERSRELKNYYGTGKQCEDAKQI